VGYSCWTGTVRGFVWLPEPAHGLPAGMSALPSFYIADDEITRAYSINNAGQIVGASATGSSPAPHRAALWEPNDEGWSLTSLGTLDDDPTGTSRARDINNLGQIIGLSSNMPVHMRTEPFIWLPTPAYGMPAGMNPLNPGHEDGDVEAINDLGQIVGSPSPVFPVPWLWLPEPAYGLPAGANLLGQFPHPTVEYTHLTSINNRGQIVGYFRYTVDEIYHETRAFIWENGAYTLIDDLLPPGTLWSCHKAYDINDAGQITGTIYADYIYQTLPIGHAVILTPVRPGDLNCDGVLDIADVEPFVLALVDPVSYATVYPACNALAADVDDDGVADGKDVGRFIELLTGG
jgi:probable HAF family extracellular repeat protein